MFTEEINRNIKIANQKLNNSEFKALSDLIMDVSGIKMPRAKKTMLEARLKKRLKKLKMSSYHEYCNYLFSEKGMDSEFVNMLNVVTTNKTDFFREPEHFYFLKTKVLPELIKPRNREFRKEIIIWSAACSTGEEPYTLAISLEQFKDTCPLLEYKILATDLSTDVLDTAKNAIYAEERIEDVSLDIKRKYFLRSKNRENKKVRIVPHLRNNIVFNRLNLLDEIYTIPKKLDVIFCRNVFIYFEREVQEAIINRFYQYLNPVGYLFMGHSESLNGFNVPFEQVAPTVYRKI